MAFWHVNAELVPMLSSLQRKAMKTNMADTSNTDETTKRLIASERAQKVARRRELWAKVKQKLPEIAKNVTTATKEFRPRSWDEDKRQSSSSKETSTKPSRYSNLSDKGKNMVKRRIDSSKVMQMAKPKQKDPLEQWMVKHSGGIIRY
ncbi:hypothetical protein M426DRAFT_260945 [Hypoxylon sp. CI-4A]|nr:hypothetical protein M426DRAFT_260945 [Hypoxylon sp. CI-4A]